MTGIFSTEHVAAILKEARHPMYSMPGLVTTFGSDNPLSIMKITPKGVIFVKGTDDTGFTHIHRRHSRYTKESFWDNFYDHKGKLVKKRGADGRVKKRLDNPSSFHPESIPINDYLLISDQIYNTRNLDSNKNKKPELFDLYEGEVVVPAGHKFIARLLTYKNTGIVHTLIPLTKEFNKNKKVIIHYSRQSSKLIFRMNANCCTAEIPYHDENGRERFKVIISDFKAEHNRHLWSVQVNDPSGKPKLTTFLFTREADFRLSDESTVHILNNTNLAIVEKEIKKIENNINWVRVNSVNDL